MSRFKPIMCRRIEIVQTPTGGFLVQIGCQQLAYDSGSAVAQLVMDYIRDPETLEREFHDSQNQGQTMPEEVRVEPPSLRR